ncbi:recombinase family protein [Evansella halocellulosilytica]|uniref:recombinase family protein n=1 Tax=Evansella halocellulosilytica TaxID=2011013 RepID=UPI000BB84AE6|nr:recombinase family protein [Evansella halocellulosilytica]
MKTVYTVANYYRSATKEKVNITNQQRKVEGYFPNNSNTLLSFKDVGVSGATLPFERPAFHELSLLVEKGVINKVVIDTIERLSRDSSHIFYIRKWFKKHGVDLVILEDLKGTSSDEQKN